MGHKEILEEIKTMLMKGRAKNVKALVEQALSEGCGMDVVLNEGLLNGMQAVIDLLKERGLRDNYIVMVGGAPVNQNFADQIGADYYTADAASAASVAKQALAARK